MKKFIGAICSGAAGLLTFIWLSLPWFATSTEGMKMTASGWQLIANKATIKGEGMSMVIEDVFTEFKAAYTLSKVFAIIALVVACLLVAYAVVLVLKNLNVIKFNFKFNLVNNIALSVFAAVVLMAVVGVVIMAIAGLKEMGNPDGLSMYASVGAWLSLVSAAAACACGWVFARKENK